MKTTGHLLAQFRRIQRHLRWRGLFHTVLMALALISAGLFLLDAVNRFFPLQESRSFQMVLGLFGLAVLYTLIMTIRWAGAPTRRHLALLLEQRFPEYQDSLICALELEERSKTSYRALEEMLLAKVEEKISGVDLLASALPPPLQGRRLLVQTVIMVCILSLALHTLPLQKAQFWGAELFRQPIGLLVTPGDLRTPENSDVTVYAIVRRWEDQARIEVKSDDGVQSHQMTLESPRHHHFTLFAVSKTSFYRIVTPSLASRWFRIDAYQPPKIVSATFDVVPPPYTRLPSRTLEGLQDLSVPEGSALGLTLAVDPGTQASWNLGQTPVAFRESSPNVLKMHVPVEQSFSYTISLRSWEGLTMETARYSVTALPDHPPLVEVFQPESDVMIHPGDRLAVVARASDDYGLRSVDLHYSVAGGARQRVNLQSTPANAAPPVEGLPSHTFDTAELHDAGTSLISYYFTATDNREPDAQDSRSEIYFIEIRPQITPKEGEGNMPQENLDVSGLITECKRLIRSSWELAGSPPEKRPPLLSDLRHALQDLHLEGGRLLNEIKAKGAGLEILDLLDDAMAEIKTAATLVSREEPVPAISHQEAALAKLVNLEILLQRNAAKSKKPSESGSQGQEGEEGQDSPKEQPQSAQERQKALADMTAQARHLAIEQDNLNQNLAGSDRESSGLAQTSHATQKKLTSQTQSLLEQLRKVSGAESAIQHLKGAVPPMQQAASMFQKKQVGQGRQYGLRAHASLLAGVEALEEIYRNSLAQELEQLSQAAKQLSEAQRQNASLSREAQKDQTQSLRQKQLDLNQSTKELLARISEKAASLAEPFPKAANALSEALQQAQQQGLDASMTRSANALLYQRFAKASQQQTKTANLLMNLGGKIAQAQSLFPAFTREKLLEALGKLQQAMAEVKQSKDSPDGKQRLKRLRDRIGPMLDRLAGELEEPALREMGNELALPSSDGAGEKQQLAQLFQAAAAVIEKHLFATEIKRQTLLNRQTNHPPEKYRSMVEQYFKALTEPAEGAGDPGQE
jgi:hypothetical protein